MVGKGSKRCVASHQAVVLGSHVGHAHPVGISRPLVGHALVHTESNRQSTKVGEGVIHHCHHACDSKEDMLKPEYVRCEFEPKGNRILDTQTKVNGGDGSTFGFALEAAHRLAILARYVDFTKNWIFNRDTTILSSIYYQF